MDPETATEAVEQTTATRAVEMDGTSFSKGPSKPVPLQPRPRTRPQSTASDETDSKPEETTNGKHQRDSAPSNLTMPDEVDSSKSSPKDKKGGLEGLMKFFMKSGSKSGKKVNINETIVEADEK